MAVNISSDYLKAQKHDPHLWYGRFRIKVAPLTKKVRAFLQETTPESKRVSRSACHITDALETQARHFQEHGWALVENILSKNFYQELVKQWPSRYWLDPPSKITKNYDLGLGWMYGQNYVEAYDHHPALKKLAEYLRTDKFSCRVKRFVGSDKDFVSYSFLIQKSYPGSQVVPHRDGIYNNSQVNNVINMLFFIKGTGGKKAGGLSLTRDAEGHDVIVEPTNLNNTCLIYDSKAPFYHGFKPMRFGTFRWSIGAQFLEKDFVEKQ